MEEIYGYSVNEVKSILRKRYIIKVFLIIIDILLIFVGSFICYKSNSNIYSYFSFVAGVSLGVWFFSKVIYNGRKVEACNIYKKYSELEVQNIELGIDEKDFDEFILKNFDIKVDNDIVSQIYYFTANGKDKDKQLILNKLLEYKSDEVVNYILSVVTDKNGNLHMVNMKGV